MQSNLYKLVVEKEPSDDLKGYPDYTTAWSRYVQVKTDQFRDTPGVSYPSSVCASHDYACDI